MCILLGEEIQGIHQILELLQTGTRLRALQWMVPADTAVQNQCLEAPTASVQVSPAGLLFLTVQASPAGLLLLTIQASPAGLLFLTGPVPVLFLLPRLGLWTPWRAVSPRLILISGWG